ncbi:MAG: hypothetical protein VB051_04930 [Candidatus Pelethousia sp.]|nr:hypothetical protein [Candidatus Pelethousia sp.]
MKKAISILLALCLLLLAGCFGPKQALEAAQQAAAQQKEPVPIPEVANASQVLEEAAESISPDTDMAAAASTPADAYAKYAEAKSAAFDRLSAKLDENEELYLSVGMAILPISMIDLSLIPLSMIGIEGGGMALAMLGMEGVDVKQAGNAYSLSYKNDEGQIVELTCEYDPATDSMRSTTTQDGQEILSFEYVKAGDSYASQYYIWDDTTQNYSWITGFFDDEKIAAFGMATVDQKQNSIFKGSGYSSDFVVNQEAYFILDGDTLTVLENGAVKTY